MINPLLISASDISGGAARAAYRLHRGFLKRVMTVQSLVMQAK
jgi:hypothetical protein